MNLAFLPPEIGIFFPNQNKEMIRTWVEKVSIAEHRPIFKMKISFNGFPS